MKLVKSRPTIRPL